MAAIRRITLPLLRPAILVAAALPRCSMRSASSTSCYVMTGGGPGTATEPIALYTFNTLMQHLRFGYGSALSVIILRRYIRVGRVAIRVFGVDAARDARDEEAAAVGRRRVLVWRRWSVPLATGR